MLFRPGVFRVGLALIVMALLILPGHFTVPAARAQAPGGLPDTPLGRQLAWVQDQLNTGGHNASAEIASRFTPEFLAAVPAAQLSGLFQQLAAAYAPLTFRGFAQSPTETAAVARYTTRTGLELAVAIAVETIAPQRIAGLQFQPLLAAWGAVDSQLSALAPRVSFLAADVSDGTCRPAHALASGQRLAIGSAFKLYVLGELAHQIAEGRAAWDEPLALRDEWKSLPSGTLQNQPAGTRLTLRQYAEQMIAISDNTAADHLLFRLGRENVEAFQASLGHGAPERNVPFLATRELFALKLSLPPHQVNAYLAASVPEQRRLRATTVAATPATLVSAASWTTPRQIDSIEWFASGEDLCRAMATLKALSERPGLEPLRDILAINPGVRFDPQTWPYIGFKGGSEPGVLNLTWLLRRADGRWFVLTTSLNNPGALVEETATSLLMPATAQLLANPQRSPTTGNPELPPGMGLLALGGLVLACGLTLRLASRPRTKAS